MGKIEFQCENSNYFLNTAKEFLIIDRNKLQWHFNNIVGGTKTIRLLIQPRERQSGKRNNQSHFNAGGLYISTSYWSFLKETSFICSIFKNSFENFFYLNFF